jgi:replication initiation protein RepC
VDSDPKQTEIRPQQHNYNPSPNPKKDTVMAIEDCNGGGEGAQTSSLPPTQPKTPEKGRVHGISPDEIVRLAPKLKLYLARPSPTWPELVDAADWLRHDLGVSKPLWGDACLAMGRELAAVALAIVSTKDPGHFRTNPGGYFHGMVAKAKVGELHLERTVWAMRRAATPEGSRRSGREGESLYR